MSTIVYPAAQQTRSVTARPASSTVRAADGSTAGSHRMRLTRRGRLVLTVLATLLTLGTASFAVQAVADQPWQPDPSVVVVVAPGETLWSIATGIAGDRDVREVVADIQDLNGMASSDLVAGQELRLPSGS